MKPMDADKIFSFIKMMQGVKEVERFTGQFFWKEYPRKKEYESVADHTWRMAMILVIIEPYLSKPIDFARTMKMALIHDIPEIIAGDASPLGSDGTGNDSHLYNEKAAEEKYKKEDAAAKEIFSKLSKDQGQELYDLWLEHEKQETFEAKIVKALDKLEGKLQAAEYTKDGIFEKHLEFSLKYGEGFFDIDPVFKKLNAMVRDEFTKDYKEFKLDTKGLI